MLAPLLTAAATAAADVTDVARPGFHYTRPAGWQNDPVPYRDASGTYHLFTLCNPNGTTQWRPPGATVPGIPYPVYDHSAWCHATSPDMATSWTTHKPALMRGPWPGVGSPGGTGNVLPGLTPVEQRDLNATSAILVGGGVLWRSSDPTLAQFEEAGPLHLPAAPKPNVQYCGDVHIYRHGRRWRVAAAGSDGLCMDGGNASIAPLVLVYESESLTFNESGAWKYISTLYTGAPGDGPRAECPTYIPAAEAGGTSILLFSKTGTTGGVCPPGTPNACPPPPSRGEEADRSEAGTRSRPHQLEEQEVPCVKCFTNGVYWATGEEDDDGVLQIKRRGRQQEGGYANEAFHDVQNDRWIVYSWIATGQYGSLNCTNSEGRVLPGCWVGAQSLPRVVSLQPDLSLKFPVAPELNKLLGTSTTVKGVGSGDLTVAPNVTLQSKVSVTVAVTSPATANGKSSGPGSPAIFFSIEMLRRRPCATCTTTSTTISLERQLGGNSTKLTLCGDSANGASCQAATIDGAFRESAFDVWIDHSVVELYSDGGAAVLVAPTGLYAFKSDGFISHATQVTAADESVNFTVSVAPVRRAAFHSDPG